jgi:hypothetical protein
MFRRTRIGRRNPKALLHSTAPPINQPTPQRRSYAEALRSGMEGNGQYGNGAGNGVCGTGNGGFRGHSQGEAFAWAGYQRPYQRYGSGGFHGGCGGGRSFDQRGRGFGGPYRQLDNRVAYGDQQQHPAPHQNMGKGRAPQRNSGTVEICWKRGGGGEAKVAPRQQMTIPSYGQT